ncbi:LysR family transcriptional regulator [Cupriavidus necator]|uniref:LysR family transcriptional regulator n=1 Tax=Cupriavidus necator TaxID=106590 RepID=A0A367PIM1_CUPNE|nr:LysR family transcriptional regulator [Cupriavidus necator]RCJ07424.1 LysR family transcriptional regulator [Cupriavidus necator]
MDARLKHAVAVSRFGSFSKAADMIGITQSAATKSVAELERRLGYPIFRRTPKGVVPTEEGQVFLERALRLLADAAELLGMPKPEPGRQTLRVGVFPATLEWLLARGIERLLTRYPEIRLDLCSGTKERGLQMLERGDVDVAIGMESMFRDRPQYQCEPIAAICPEAFVRRGHPLLAGKPPADARLTDFPLILPSEIWHSSLYPSLARLCGDDWVGRCHKIESLALSCKVVECSDAIGLADIDFSLTEYFRERFVTLHDVCQIPPVRIDCAVRKQWEPKAAAKALIAMLQAMHADGRPRSDMGNRILAHELAAPRGDDSHGVYIPATGGGIPAGPAGPIPPAHGDAVRPYAARP